MTELPYLFTSTALTNNAKAVFGDMVDSAYFYHNRSHCPKWMNEEQAMKFINDTLLHTVKWWSETVLPENWLNIDHEIAIKFTSGKLILFSGAPPTASDGSVVRELGGPVSIFQFQ